MDSYFMKDLQDLNDMTANALDLLSNLHNKILFMGEYVPKDIKVMEEKVYNSYRTLYSFNREINKVLEKNKHAQDVLSTKQAASIKSDPNVSGSTERSNQRNRTNSRENEFPFRYFDIHCTIRME